jgi:cobalt/nickel transport system ATP-binding protein
LNPSSITSCVLAALDGFSQMPNSSLLNAGGKKCITIVTVLSMNPSILVLDNPSAWLDPRARRTLINLLRELPIMMLVTTYDMRLVQELFPRTIVRDKGQIVADRLTMEILENEALLNEHGLEKP